eukprot:898154-Pleurochrysis_carterae.AAC.1
MATSVRMAQASALAILSLGLGLTHAHIHAQADAEMQMHILNAPLAARTATSLHLARKHMRSAVAPASSARLCSPMCAQNLAEIPPENYAEESRKFRRTVRCTPSICMAENGLSRNQFVAVAGKQSRQSVLFDSTPLKFHVLTNAGHVFHDPQHTVCHCYVKTVSIVVRTS